MKKSIFLFKNFIYLIIITSIIFVLYGFKPARGYGYNYYQEIIAAPPAFSFSHRFTAGELGLESSTTTIDEIKDVLVISDYQIKVVATKTKLSFYDQNFKLINQITQYSFYEDGSVTPITKEFTGISSISYFDHQIYVSDQGDADESQEKQFHKILVLDLSYEINKYVVSCHKYIQINDSHKVHGLEKAFKPYKIGVSKSGSIYALCQDTISGIAEINSSSEFKRFIGNNMVKLSFWEKFWHKITSKTMSGREQKIPSNFISFTIDSSGFIYTVSASNKQFPIQKLNPKGENVLIENGNTPVKGDIYTDEKDSSAFIDIDINQDGIFLVLDSKIEKNSVSETQNKKIFAYNDTGDLLYVIGGYGKNSSLSFENPKLVRWDGKNIIVVDVDNRILYLTPTEYGSLINDATHHYYNGEFEAALPYWEKLINLNSNNELAHIGIGKVNLQRGDYHTALQNFKDGNNRLYYSKAYEKVRNARLSKTLIPIFITVICLVVIYKGVTIWIERHY